jgi:hypothetical protein
MSEPEEPLEVGALGAPRHLAELSAGGQFTASGLPRPMAGACLILQYRETGHAAFPPVGVQRLLTSLILRGAHVAAATQTLAGRARSTPTGTHVRFDWTVRAARPLLRILTPFLRPVLRANHNWAIARAIAGLEPYARGTAARPHAADGVLDPFNPHSPAT